MGESRRAQRLKLASRAVRWEYFPTAREATTIPGRWAAYWFGCKSERHGVRSVESELSMHVSLTFAVGERGGCRKTKEFDLFCDG